MNERIRELAEQAREYANSSQPYEKIKNKAWIDVYDEKFAKLIVRECMLCVDACESEMFYDDGMVPIIDVNDRIKQHFGVE